jgi:hypothetical protein
MLGEYEAVKSFNPLIEHCERLERIHQASEELRSILLSIQIDFKIRFYHFEGIVQGLWIFLGNLEDQIGDDA